jgi:hypothetical protein
METGKKQLSSKILKKIIKTYLKWYVLTMTRQSPLLSFDIMEENHYNSPYE